MPTGRVHRHGRGFALSAALVALAATLLPSAAQAQTGVPGRLSDNFDRPDSSSLGAADTGQGWSSLAGSWGIAAQAAGAGQGYSLAVIDSGAATGIVSVRVSSTSPEFWLVLRASDGANYWRFGRWASGPYELQQIVSNGLGTPAATTSASVQAAPGDLLSCQLLSQGLTCSVNGTQVVSTTDTFNGAATSVGLATWEPSAPSSVRFDDLVVRNLSADADLVTTIDAASSVQSGQQVTWTAAIRNVGGATATDVVVSGPRPDGVSGLAASASTGSCTTGDQIVCGLDALMAGQTATVVISGLATAAGSTTLSLAAATSAFESKTADNAASRTVIVSEPPPGGTLLYDGFDRADASTLGTAPTGQVWSTVHGGFAVASGRAAPTSGGYSLALVDGGASSGIVSARVAVSAPEFWLVLRASDGANYWRFGHWQSGPYQLQQIAGNGLGSPTVSTFATVQPADGDVVSCRLAGDGIGCTVNGSLLVSTADLFNVTASAVGFATYGSTQARYDDLALDVLPTAADLAVAITDFDPVVTGGTLRWTVTVSNVGHGPALDPAVTFTAVPGLTGATASTTSGTCSSAQGCSLAPLAAGASAEVAVEAVAPADPGSVTLSATASATGDPEGSNDTRSETTRVRAPFPQGTRVLDDFDRADGATLGAATTGQAWTQHHGAFGVAAAQAAPTTPGYSLALLDGGGPSGVVSVTVPVVAPEYWLIVRGADAANYWRFGRTGAGNYQLQQIVNNALGSAPVTITASVPAANGDQLRCRYLDGSVACSVNGTPVASAASGADPTAGRVGLAVWDPSGVPSVRFDDVLVTEVPPVLDVSVSVADVDPVLVNGTLRWTITVANVGSQAVTGTSLGASLPSGISDVAATSSQGSCQVGAAVTCPIGSLAADAAAQVVITARAPAEPGSVVLWATVGVDGEDSNTANDTEVESTTVRMPPPPGARVIDGFDTAGPLVVTDTGEEWTMHAGSFVASGGAAGATSAAPSLASVDTGFAHGTYELTVSDVGDRRFWLAFRVVDASNYFRFGPDAAGIYRLEKVVGGQAQPVAISIRRADVVASDGDVIRAVNRPDDGMFVSVNGVHVVDAGDVSSMAASRFGFATASTTVRFGHLDIGQVMTASVMISDSFSRPDGLPLGRVESGVAYDWWQRGGGDWGVAAGQAYYPGTVYGVVAADTSSEAADFRAAVSTVSDDFALVFRYGEDDSYYRFGRLHAGGGYDVDLIHGWSSSAPPGPVERLSSPVPADGDVLEVRQFLDGRIECLVDGAVVLRFTDTVTNRRSTIYGFASGSSAARFDDVMIVPE